MDVVFDTHPPGAWFLLQPTHLLHLRAALGSSGMAAASAILTGTPGKYALQTSAYAHASLASFGGYAQQMHEYFGRS